MAMLSFCEGSLLGRIGSLKFSDKFNRVSVAVNYNKNGVTKCNWFDVFDFNHQLDDLDESFKGKIISLKYRLHPTFSKIGDVNVHNYILVLFRFDIITNKDFFND